MGKWYPAWLTEYLGIVQGGRVRKVYPVQLRAFDLLLSKGSF